MCIIVAKNAGVKMVSDEILNNCWKSNPDGAGFMWASDGKVHIKKGLMTLNALKTELRNLGTKKELKDIPLVIHFRISTQAGVNPQNTHPFPISRKYSKLTALDGESSVGGLAHNGIIPCCTSKAANEKYSDTIYFVKRYVSKAATVSGWMNNKMVMDYLEKVANSKLAIMSTDGEIATLGTFNTQDGVLYSNYTYENWTKRYGYYDYGYNQRAWSNIGSRFTPEYVHLYKTTREMYWLDLDTYECQECEDGEQYYDVNGAFWWIDKQKWVAYMDGSTFVYVGNRKAAPADSKDRYGTHVKIGKLPTGEYESVGGYLSESNIHVYG